MLDVVESYVLCCQTIADLQRLYWQLCLRTQDADRSCEAVDSCLVEFTSPSKADFGEHKEFEYACHDVSFTISHIFCI